MEISRFIEAENKGAKKMKISWQKIRGILIRNGFRISRSWGSSRLKDGYHWKGVEGLEFMQFPDGFNKKVCVRGLNDEQMIKVRECLINNLNEIQIEESKNGLGKTELMIKRMD